MKKFLIALNLVIWSFVGYQATAYAAEPKKDAPAVQNDNCVKKDKNGKCPPLPQSPKPTPKKPAEKK
jgi:hypothetical protein